MSWQQEAKSNILMAIYKMPRALGLGTAKAVVCLLQARSALDQLTAYLCSDQRALQLEITAFVHEPLHFLNLL